MRWENLSAADDRARRLPAIAAEAVRTFDAPEALDTRFYEVHAKSVLNRVAGKSRMPFKWTVNPYRGCSHACRYCYARTTHRYLNLDAGRDFEKEIVVKVNAPERLRAELARPSWKHEHVALGTNTDPYQWVESRYRLMPGIWQALLDSGTPCSLVTKSPLLLRDVDLLQALAEYNGFTAYLSIPTIDEQAWRASEPHTPHPRKRLEAVAKLNAAGVPAGILIAPLMPGINDSPEQVDEILAGAQNAGAISVGAMGLHLRGEVRDVFMSWLGGYRPDLVDHYEQLYERGAYLPGEERKRLSRLARYNRPDRWRKRMGERRGLTQARPRPTPQRDEPAQQSLF